MALTKVSSSLVSDDAVTSAKIVDGGIATADIAANAVTSAKIAQNSILTKHIDDGQVTTDQLGADAVTAAKIADDAISEEHLDITVITSLTEVAAATGDLLMVADASDSNNLKKIPVSSILAGTHTGPIGSGSNAVNVGTVTATGNLSMATDNATIFIGADLDLRLTHSGSAGTLTNNTGNLTLDVAGDIILDADGGNLKFADAGVIKLDIYQYNSNLYFDNPVSDSDIIFQGVDGSTSISALTLDMSVGGQLKAAPLGVSTPTYAFSNDSNTGMTRPTGDTLQFVTGGTERIRIDSRGAIGFGTTPPTDTHTGWNQFFIGQKGSIISENATGTHGFDGMLISDNLYVDTDTGAFANIETNESSLYMQEAGTHKFFSQASGSAGAAVTLSEKMRMDSSGKVGIGTTSPSAFLTVTGSEGSQYAGSFTNTSAQGWGLFVKGGADSADYSLRVQDKDATELLAVKSNGNVGIGTNDPASKLHIKNTASEDTAIILENTNNAQNLNIDYYSNAGSVQSRINYAEGPAAWNFIPNVSNSNSALYINYSANVGIGTTGPDYKLTVNGGGSNAAKFQTNSSAVLIGEHSSGAVIWLDGSNGDFSGGDYFGIHALGTTDLSFSYASAIGMTMKSDGNVGMGTTDPSSFNSRGRNLVVNSDGDTGITISANTSSSSTLLFADAYAGTGGTAAYRGIIEYDHATDHMAISTAAAEKMRILSTGQIVIGSASYGASLGQLRIINDAASAPASMSLFGYNNIADNAEFARIDFASQISGTGGNPTARIAAHIEGTNERAADLVFSTHNDGGSLQDRMRILSTGQIVTGGLASTSAALHLYSDNSWSGILTLQSQAAANATAQIAFMSRDSSNVNDDAYIKYNNSGGSTTNQLDFLPSNNRTFSVSNHGSTHYGDESSTNGIGKFIGSVAPHGSGHRYIHIQISTTYNEMAHIKILGYSYTSAILEGMACFYFYDNANRTTLYDGRYSGSVVGGYCNSSNNYAEIVIDTLTATTTNRWGSISVYGGQDKINAYHHTEIVQVAYSGANSRQFT